MPALDLMPSGVRCAPWGEWLQGPESPCGTSAQTCSLQDMCGGLQVQPAPWSRARDLEALKLNSNSRHECPDCLLLFDLVSWRWRLRAGRWRPLGGRPTVARRPIAWI